MNQSELPDEVIIADDGSGSETRELIESFQEKFPVPLMHVWHEDKGFRKLLFLIRPSNKLRERILFRLMAT